MKMTGILCGALLGAGLMLGTAEIASASIWTEAVADAHRPADDRAQDALRKPAQTMAFAGIRRGQAVADFLPGGGYFTRLFSDVVGPSGHVTMLETTRWGAENIAADQKVIDEGRKNVSLDKAAFGTFHLDAPVDVFWTSRNYHDLLIAKYGVVDMAAFNRHVFASLKPGGLYIVLDHSAPAGTGSSLTATTHRIDEALVKSQVQAAGFKFEGESPLLRNPADDRKSSVFDKKIQGHTGQFLLKFRKPG
jgi:predicted methyltransferase